MTNDYILSPQTADFLRRAIEEDVGSGDITTMSAVAPGAIANGRYIAKDDGVICGFGLVRAVFDMLGGGVSLDVRVNDGDRVSKGQTLAHIRGDASVVLTGERVGLNLLQHLSGVATATAAAIKAVSGCKAASGGEVKITDTRKTTAGMRALEKYAVRRGGGTNHRFSLADGVLIKDNHIAAAGSITAAVAAAKKNAPHTLKIEVEVENEAMLLEALDAGADIVMLDNMSVGDMKRAVELTAGRALTEASGNMGERDLREVALTGVDLISIGALTHSVRALDISLKLTLDGAETGGAI